MLAEETIQIVICFFLTLPRLTWTENCFFPSISDINPEENVTVSRSEELVSNFPATIQKNFLKQTSLHYSKKFFKLI